MKKNILAVLLGLSMAVLTISCSKSDSPAAINNGEVTGKWVGLVTPPVGPSRYFALTFNAGGTLLVEQNSQTTPDIANGSWSQVTADSVNATYTFTGSTDVYRLTGKYGGDVKVMNGSLGIQPNTTGAGEYSVTKN